MKDTRHTFLPGLGVTWALRFYDPIARMVGVDRRRRSFLEGLDLRGARRILDVGCGTGSLAVELKRAHPAAQVVGLDPDPDALELARAKAERAGLDIRFEHGFADALPFPEGDFDQVVSTFALHHVPKAQRQPAARELRRVLAPGGHVDVLDFVHGDSIDDVRALMTAAGFTSVRFERARGVLAGLLAVGHFRGQVPSADELRARGATS